MSLVTVDREIARRLSCRDQAKDPIGRLSVNRVSCRAGPPASDCTQMFPSVA